MQELSQENKPNSDEIQKMEQEIHRDEQERDHFRKENGTIEDYDPKVEDPKYNDMDGFDGDNSVAKLGQIMMVVFIAMFIRK
jgi:hypothetical protein